MIVSDSAVQSVDDLRKVLEADTTTFQSRRDELLIGGLGRY